MANDTNGLRCLLADEECLLFFVYAYLPEMFVLVYAGEVRLFPGDVSDTCPKFRLIVHLLARI